MRPTRIRDRLISRRERVVLAATLVVIGLVTALCGACQIPSDARSEQSGVASPVTPDPQITEMVMAQTAVLQAMHLMYPQVEVDVVWRMCGQENSYYFSQVKRIVLCTEMSSHPGTALFFAAHEFGHAVTGQILDTLDEQDADEIGALALIQLDLKAELLEAALYHKSQPWQWHLPGDSHPSNRYRAWELACLEDGSEDNPVSPICGGFYRAIATRWAIRIGDAQTQTSL